MNKKENQNDAAANSSYRMKIYHVPSIPFLFTFSQDFISIFVPAFLQSLQLPELLFYMKMP